MVNFILAALLMIIASCSRAPIKNPTQALRKINYSLELTDSLKDQVSFELGLETIIGYLNKSPSRKIIVSDKSYDAAEYALRLREVLEFSRLSNMEETIRFVQSQFDIYEVYGLSDYSEILLTSYYAPEIKGSTVPTERFSTPLHTLPDNTIEIDLKDFSHTEFPYQITDPRKIFAKLEQKENSPPQVKPMPSRREIYEKDPHPENVLCYVDKIDAFFLQIQGSGTVILEDGSKLRLGYVGQNSRRYQSIGKFLTDVIPLEEMSMQAIDSYLRQLPENEIQTILNMNPSYVYFNKIKTPPMTTSNTAVIAGRTLAVDTTYFPLGLLGFLKVPTSFEKLEVENHEGRFIFSQDTGGAIKGAHRADLYWGEGEEAALVAGKIKHKAYLYFLFPKDKR